MADSFTDITETCKDVETARKFVSEVGQLARKYDANYFVVTDGASGISNSGNEAVKHARDSHIEWEKKHGHDPYEDWGKKKEAEESVGSTVGPMLPQPPYGGHGDIVEKIGAGTMSEEYTESIAGAVGGAVKGAAGAVTGAAGKVVDTVKGAGEKSVNTLKTGANKAVAISNSIQGKGNIQKIEDPYPNDSLPGSIRDLANEYGFLLGKRRSLGRFTGTSDRKDSKYHRRLTAIMSTYQKQLNSNNDPALKAQMTKDWEARVKYYKKKAMDMVVNHEITESYNNTITELIEMGAIPKDTPLLTEEYFETKIEYDQEIFDICFTEGTNLDLMKSNIKTVHDMNKAVKAIRKDLRKKDFESAMSHMTDAMNVQNEVEDAIKKFHDDEKSSETPNIFLGFILGTLVPQWSAFVKSVSKFNGKRLLSMVSPLHAAIESFDHYSKRIKEKGDVSVEDTEAYNMVYRQAISTSGRIGETLKEMEKLIKEEQAKYEVEQKGKEVKESTEDFSREILLTYLYENGIMSYEDYLDEYFTEARNPDEGIKPILKKLNEKGYKTKYSCTGHKDSGKHDRNDDGIVNGKLVSAARIQFDKDYHFPAPPKHWGWKSVEGADYLYVLPITAKKNMSDTEHSKAFDQWKAQYMSTLETWVDNLKPASQTNDEIISDIKKGDSAYDKKHAVVESVVTEAAVDSQSVLDDAFAMFSIGVNY